MPYHFYLPSDVRSTFARIGLRLLQNRKPLPRAPRHVQIQTVTGCNARCHFCPSGRTRSVVPVGRRMDWSLYRSILDQVIDLGARRLTPYFMNEPLLDPEMPERIEYVTRRKRRSQYTRINTHGGLLTETMAKGLLDSGLDRLFISVQALDPGSTASSRPSGTTGAGGGST